MANLFCSKWRNSRVQRDLPRNFIQSEVSIHATCSNLNMLQERFKKRATFVLQQCFKTSCTSLRPFLPYLKVYLSFVDSIRCLSQSRCLVLQWWNYYNLQLIRRMLNLPFPERPCLEWVRLCRDCTRPFWPRMAELILSWEYIIVVVLHLFTGTDCFYRKNFLAFSMSKTRQLSTWEHVNVNNHHRGHTISSTYNFPSL